MLGNVCERHSQANENLHINQNDIMLLYLRGGGPLASIALMSAGEALCVVAEGKYNPHP